MRTERVLIGLVMLVAVAMGCKPSGDSHPAAATADPAVFGVLTGRWVRADGGYMLMVHRIEPDGKAAAGYFNPNPIHVSQAQASREGGAVKLFVELNDQGYPGCTYKLTHDKEKDRLVGVYFQAAQQASYDIMFERMP